MSPVSPNPRRGGPVKQRYFAGAKSAAALLSVPVRWRSRGADWRGDAADRVRHGLLTQVPVLCGMLPRRTGDFLRAVVGQHPVLPYNMSSTYTYSGGHKLCFSTLR